MPESSSHSHEARTLYAGEMEAWRASRCLPRRGSTWRRNHEQDMAYRGDIGRSRGVGHCGRATDPLPPRRGEGLRGEFQPDLAIRALAAGIGLVGKSEEDLPWTRSADRGCQPTFGTGPFPKLKTGPL